MNNKITPPPSPGMNKTIKKTYEFTVFFRGMIATAIGLSVEALILKPLDIPAERATDAVSRTASIALLSPDLTVAFTKKAVEQSYKELSSRIS